MSKRSRQASNTPGGTILRRSDLKPKQAQSDAQLLASARRAAETYGKKNRLTGNK